MRRLYTLFFYLILPIIVVRLLWRAYKVPTYAKRWKERFGFLPDLGGRSYIWLHAVSVGEANAAISLVKQLRQQFPEEEFLVTTMTPTGAARIENAFQGMVKHSYIPYDLPGPIRRFLSKVKPKLAIIMETELWPNLLHQCHKNQVPILLANARLSERSARRYAYISRLTKQMLNQLTFVAAQSKMEVRRFMALGLLPEKIQVTGSIKFDIEMPASLAELASALRQQWGAHKQVLIAASTHEGEEQLLLKSFKVIKNKLPNALLVLVPRHPQRFAKVTALARKQGFITKLRSENLEGKLEAEVFIGDSMGELPLFYSAADVAFVGGSLIPHGGQNLLEPAALGIPIITGKHTFNFAEVTRLLRDAGGLNQIKTQTELERVSLALLEDGELRHQIGSKAKAVVAKNRGAVGRHIEIIKILLQLETETQKSQSTEKQQACIPS